MTAREQAGNGQLDCVVLAHDDFANLLRESLNVIGHAGMICGNNLFRKHGAGGMSSQPVTLLVLLFRRSI